MTLAPDYTAARHDYARALLERHKHLRAKRRVGEAAAAGSHANRQHLTLYATVCVGLGANTTRRPPLYRQLLVDAPQAADLHLSLAHALKTLGRREESVDSYRAAADHPPQLR